MSKPQGPNPRIQCKVVSMNDENKNLPFGNNINEHDAASTRIIFVDPNGLDICTDANYLMELLDNRKHNNTNIILLAEINTLQ